MVRKPKEIRNFEPVLKRNGFTFARMGGRKSHFIYIKTTMNKEKALKKLQKAKQEALANSTDIRVGRLELNEAMKALRTIIALQNILKDE